MLVTTLVVIIAHGQGETYLEEEVPEESYRCASAVSGELRRYIL